MFEIGWYELLIVFVVALVVIGPKDLPKALYTVGKWVRQARMIAGDFQRSIDKVVEDAELKDARDKLRMATSLSPHQAVKDAVFSKLDVGGQLASAATALQAEAAAVDQALANQAPVAPLAEVSNADILSEMAHDTAEALLPPPPAPVAGPGAAAVPQPATTPPAGPAT